METKSILPAIWDLPAAFRRRMGATVGRQRAMFEEGHLLLVLHAPPTPDNDLREGRYFWRDPAGEWRSSDCGSGPSSLSVQLDGYDAAIEECDDKFESASSANDYFQVIERLAPLYRAASNQHQVLQEARKLVDADRTLIDVRDRAYQIERTASLLYDGAKNALDYAMAKRAEDQAKASHQMSVASHRLNLMASFFFPIATLSALFGVNMLHGWEETGPPYYPFIALLAAGLATGFILTRFVTRPA